MRVRLSRNAIVATEGAAHAEADVDVDPNRPLSVQVVGKKNVSITGTGADVFALPPGGGSSELTFTGAGTRRPDRASSPIVVKQGAVRSRTMTLKATAVPESDAAHDAAGHHVRGRGRTRASTRPSSRACRASTSTSAS